jgi:hypothetical protein
MVIMKHDVFEKIMMVGSMVKKSKPSLAAIHIFCFNGLADLEKLHIKDESRIGWDASGHTLCSIAQVR